jgi:hypothetical protein
MPTDRRRQRDRVYQRRRTLRRMVQSHIITAAEAATLLALYQRSTEPRPRTRRQAA